MKKTVAIIPIRSGSKRVPDKNIRLVNGKPLVFYLIDTMLEVYDIEKIIVSTDSILYKDIIENAYGNRITVDIRSSDISGDKATLEECILSILEKGLCDNYKTIILSQATSPLVKKESIEKGLSFLERNPLFNSVGSCTRFMNFFTSDIDRLVRRPRTQDMKNKTLETGCFWIFKKKPFLETKNRIIKPIHFIEVSKTESLDIDTEEDLFIVESVIKNMKNNDFFLKRECTKEDQEYSYLDIREDPDGVKRDQSKEFNKKYEFYKNEIDFINSIAVEGNKFLDLGCGRGFVIDNISTLYNVFALEVNLGYYRSIKENVEEENIYIGELDENTYPNDFFDVIFCGHVIEHVKDPISLLKNVNRILKRHGHLVIATPDFKSFIADRFKDNFRLLHDKTHISLFGDKSLDDLLDFTGFHVDKTDRPFFETEYFTQDNVLRLFDTSKVSPPFYGNIITKYCRKK